jgi:hypothetical protein
MNNLHRELAPISGKAWAQIEEEASRTLKRHLAARRVVDVPDPKGLDLSAVGTGHLHEIKPPGDGIKAAQRDTKAIVELRVPFELSRQQIDDVERGATDSDWSPVKDAARRIAFAEDRAVFNGYAAAGIQGVRESSSNQEIVLPSSVKGYPGSVAQAVSQLRLRWCWARTCTPRPAEEATKATRSSITSSAWWTEGSSGRPQSKAASWLRPAAATSSWISARTYPSATRAIPARPWSSTFWRHSPFAS